MSLSVALRAAAKAELRKAAKWYEKKKAGLGEDLVDRVQLALDSIAEQPDRYAVVFKSLRKKGGRHRCAQHPLGRSGNGA